MQAGGGGWRRAYAVDMPTDTSRTLTHTITATHTHLLHHHGSSRQLFTSLTSTRAARSHVRLSHGSVLEYLTCGGSQYTRCTRVERPARRRAVWTRAAHAIASWEESMIPVRRATERERRSTRETLVSAGAAQREKRALMAVKVDLRLLNRRA